MRMLDAVLRRGETLDLAERAATKGIHSFADRALARAIASEVLRWLVDLDAMIDSATQRNLPGDAKPRVALRIMLAQWLRARQGPGFRPGATRHRASAWQRGGRVILKYRPCARLRTIAGKRRCENTHLQIGGADPMSKA